MDMVRAGGIDLIINTSSHGRPYFKDSAAIRSAAVMRGIPCITTLSGAQASVNSIESVLKKGVTVKAIQEYYSEKGK
jgi:carbamoyl-phosphate synthase large subunit